VDSFTIIVKGSTDAMARVHDDRMAVVLAPKDYDALLDPKRENVDDVQSILARTSAKGLVMHRVATAASNTRSQGPMLIEPIDGETVSAA
jgi:putative SOS response-associated peptidase YedK